MYDLALIFICNLDTEAQKGSDRFRASTFIYFHLARARPQTIHKPFLYGSNGCERYPIHVRDSDGEIRKIYRKCSVVCQVSNTSIICQVTVAEHCRFLVACAKNLEHTDVILHSDITVAAEIYGTNFAQHRRSIKPGRLLTSNHSTTS
jgi:hypothetical protein